MTIGTTIRQERSKKRMSQRLLADLVGVSQSTIHNWESEFSSPDGEEIKKLADALGIPISQLFNERNPLKALQQDSDNVSSHRQGTNQFTQSINYEELALIQKELIQTQKSRIVSLEEENERLRSQQIQ